MKKLLTCSIALLLGIAVGAVQAQAETSLEQRINNKVQKTVQSKTIPQQAKTAVELLWVDYNIIQENIEPRYREEGSTTNQVSCSAILRNYQEKEGKASLTVSFDKNCFNEVKNWSDTTHFLFRVNLGKFGSYSSGDLAGQPFFFETEVEKTQDTMARLFRNTKTANGNMYTFTMPVRNSVLKKSLKTFFNKNGAISQDSAAKELKKMPKPDWQRKFEADR